MNTIPAQFEFTASPDGKAVLFKATPVTGQPTSINLPIEVVGDVATSLLDMATACAQVSKPNAQPLLKPNSQAEFSLAHAKSVAVQEIPDKPNSIAVCFSFGATVIGIGLNRSLLRGLGTALLAMSADQQSPPQ
jgi:hypothetical protein